MFSDNILMDFPFRKALKLTSDKYKREINFNLTFHENAVQSEAMSHKHSQWVYCLSPFIFSLNIVSK